VVELSFEDKMMNRTLIALVVVAAVTAGCGRKQPPVVAAAPPPSATAPAGPPAAVAPPVLVDPALPVPPQPPLAEDTIANRSLDDLNRDSPLRPVFFQLDSSELDAAGRAVASANAEILKKNATWVVTIEGHCDERGSAEYNLALGERRAGAVRGYMLAQGIPAERIRTVSYGKEYPFDPGHTEEAWGQNRRGHFVITSR
jgi:peptidoglycan-associated lipoprotein